MTALHHSVAGVDPSEYYFIRWGPEFCGHNQTKPMETIATQVVNPQQDFQYRGSDAQRGAQKVLAGLWEIWMW